MTDYYIKFFQIVHEKPSACISCGSKNLHVNEISIILGIKSEKIEKENLLCKDCKCLMIVTEDGEYSISIKGKNQEDKIFAPTSLGRS